MLEWCGGGMVLCGVVEWCGVLEWCGGGGCVYYSVNITSYADC